MIPGNRLPGGWDDGVEAARLGDQAWESVRERDEVTNIRHDRLEPESVSGRSCRLRGRVADRLWRESSGSRGWWSNGISQR